jgi:hypothetical protein
MSPYPPHCILSIALVQCTHTLLTPAWVSWVQGGDAVAVEGDLVMYVRLQITRPQVGPHEPTLEGLECRGAHAQRAGRAYAQVLALELGRL